ncbi:MAG: hemolysin family protein [Cyanobacteria bacterium]|nr:hemolysin family protein [Cyanobacteriota bacterium]MDW8201097.1 hemolysin family protein [Cyanobacteriota bacterium SKYGB_h_bin112]
MTTVTAQLTTFPVVSDIAAILLLIAINALFVTAEFAIVSVRRSRINQLVEAGDVQAVAVQDLQHSLERLLSTTQIGITLSILALGWIGENAVATALASWLTQLKLPIAHERSIHTIAALVIFLLIAYLQIVLGELVPKSLALLYSEQLARVLAAPSLALSRLFNPVIWVLNQSTQGLLRLVGIRHTGQGWLHHQLTSEELQLIIATERESPELEEDQRELLTNVLEFRDVTTSDVMVPRTSIVPIPYTATFQTLLDQVAKSGYSRYPVIGESLDEIRGIVAFKKLAEPLARGELQLETPIQPWVSPAQFVPENMPLSELLEQMQESNQSMMVVVDEFGGTAGLVTLDDVLIEIIGDLPEMEEESQFQVLDDQTYLVQAQMHIEEVNELLNIDLPITDDYQTLGGFLLYQFQKIPTVGEVLVHDDLELTVISAVGPRLHQIQIHRLVTAPPPSTDGEGTINGTTTPNQADADDRMP